MKIKMSLSELESAMEDDNRGACVYCGEEAYGVEPDARKYTCESCDKPGVYGYAELLMGMIEVTEANGLSEPKVSSSVAVVIFQSNLPDVVKTIAFIGLDVVINEVLRRKRERASQVG